MIHNPTLPKKWSEDLAYLFGLLLGDGSLPKAISIRPDGSYQKRYIISFYSISKDFLEEVYMPLFQKLFNLATRIRFNHKKNFDLYNCVIETKKVYNFLEMKGFTIGRKARITKIPRIPKKYHFALLAGLLDTDGGKKGSGFGFSTASKNLAGFCENIFKELKLPYNSCPWNYKGHIYNQIYVGKRNMHKIIKHIHLKNKEKLKFIHSYAPVA